jgi:hypothetical protein
MSASLLIGTKCSRCERLYEDHIYDLSSGTGKLYCPGYSLARLCGNGLGATWKTKQSAKIDAASQAVNDHVCPTCKNNRCSKSEKTCWKCGGKL